MPLPVELALIAARSKNGVIGQDGKLPWRLADDLAFFKAVTVDHPVIMGRKTWESLPKRPLPGRDNIVLSRDWAYRATGARIYTDLYPAMVTAQALARARRKQRAFIVGGGAIYAAAIDHARFLYITEVDTEIAGDTFFPPFDEKAFEEIDRLSFHADRKNDHAFHVRILKRQADAGDKP